MQTLDKAIELAKTFPVFPCGSDKAPTCKHGFKDATQDEDRLRFLWGKYPGTLIGVPTGEKSGFDALDIDPRHGGQTWLEQAIDSLPITQINHTRSGGCHFLMRHRDGVKNSAGRIGRGVDTRGTGGFIIWWPAEGHKVKNAGIIDTWPDWLVKMLQPPARVFRQVQPATMAEASMRARIMIERAYARVRLAPCGQRHFHLRAAAATLGGLLQYTTATKDQIERDLVELIMQAGGEDQENARKTARWAIDKGSGSPLLSGG